MSKRRKGPGGGAHHPWQPLERATDEVHRVIAAALNKRMADAGLDYGGHDAYYQNDRYAVHVTYWRLKDGTMTDDVQEISFKRHDRQWPNDWRDAMRIKNEVAGADTEAVELYPAMERVVDTANQRFLWCFPVGNRPTWDGEHVIGFAHGARLDPDAGLIVGAQQRPFDPNDPERDRWDDDEGRVGLARK